MSIEHVSDTARWVAIYRAMESERPDALFRDPWARRLAGEKGQAIVDGMRRGRSTAWAMIVRTAVIDELIEEALAGGDIDTVVNLAAGLDARPWRMELPPGLRWVDVDLPGILDHKLGVLDGEPARCDYRALRVDLREPEARREALADATAGSRSALVLAEGLLIYLEADDVAALARDLHDVPSVRTWVIDIASPKLLQWMHRSWGKETDQGSARFRFAPEEGTAFFEPLGWREGEFRSNWREAHRLGRDMRFGWLWRLLTRFSSEERKRQADRMAGVVRLDRIDG